MKTGEKKSAPRMLILNGEFFLVVAAITALPYWIAMFSWPGGTNLNGGEKPTLRSILECFSRANIGIFVLGLILVAASRGARRSIAVWIFLVMVGLSALLGPPAGN
jgi:hypothetical protein